MRTETIAARSSVERAASARTKRPGARAFRRVLRDPRLVETAPPVINPLHYIAGGVPGRPEGPSPSLRGACSAVCAAVERAVGVCASTGNAVGTVRLASGETASVRVRVDGGRVDVTIIASVGLAAG